MRDRCLNCLSFSHRLANCQLPLRCWKCRGFRHLARECKRPRSPAQGASRGGDRGHERFVRARRGPDSPGTPAGSQATRTTPAGSPPPAAADSSVADDREPLPPGHPEERQWESTVIIQRSAVIDDAEAGLRLALTAMAADATRIVSIADAARAMRSIDGVAEGSFSVAPFYP